MKKPEGVRGLGKDYEKFSRLDVISPIRKIGNRKKSN